MEDKDIKGYDIKSGWVGILPDGRKQEFPTEDEYTEFMREFEREEED